jgi:ribosomal subunit interface protein
LIIACTHFVKHEHTGNIIRLYLSIKPLYSIDQPSPCHPNGEAMMLIDIRTPSFSLTSALRERIERRLGLALSARDQHIQRVLVRLSDINGPRGGADKQCHIQVVLTHLPDVVIENTEADVYAAIDQAADRVGRTLAHRLARQRDRRRPSQPTDSVSCEVSPHLAGGFLSSGGHR